MDWGNNMTQREKRKPYTVVGFWVDNNQPWVEHVTALNPREAAGLAVWAMKDNPDTEADDDNLEVVEVLEGHVKGVLGDDTTLSGTRCAEVLLENKERLPTLMGLYPSLDKAIEEILKKG